MSKAWPLMTIGEVLQLQRRWIKLEPDQLYTEIGVRSFGKGIFLKSPVTGLSLGNKRVLRVCPGDLVFNNVFAWEGAVGVASETEAGTIGSHRFVTYTVKDNQADVQFLRLFFRTEAGLTVLQSVSPGSAGRNRTLNLDHFARQHMPLPPLPEQQRIVATIDELAAKSDEARRLRIEVAATASGLLRSVFNGLISNAEYRVMNLAAPLVRRRVDVQPEGQYPELGIRSFGKGTFHKPPLQGMEVGTKKLYRIEPGDLVFNNVFAWEGAVAVARPKDAGRVGSHRFITCVPQRETATARFLRFYFLTEEGLAKVGEASPGGAGRNRTLGLQALGEIQVPVIPFQKQVWFDDLQSRMDEVAEARTRSELELDALLPSILDRAFKGELA